MQNRKRQYNRLQPGIMSFSFGVLWSVDVFHTAHAVTNGERAYIYIYNHRSTDENLAAQERFRSMEEQQSGRLQLGQPGLEVEDPCIDSESWFR